MCAICRWYRFVDKRGKVKYCICLIMSYGSSFIAHMCNDVRCFLFWGSIYNSSFLLLTLVSNHFIHLFIHLFLGLSIYRGAALLGAHISYFMFYTLNLKYLIVHISTFYTPYNWINKLTIITTSLNAWIDTYRHASVFPR